MSMPEMDVFNHLRSLESAGLLYDDEDCNLTERRLVINSLTKNSPFPVSILINDFCVSNNFDLHKMFVKLDFSELA
jgi:hypothetical protein